MMKATIFALLVVLAVPSLAEAECAWVLWSKAYAMRDGQPSGDVFWEYVDAAETKARCEALGRDTRDRRKPNPALDVFFVCAPDTVDPRGPKGGGR